MRRAILATLLLLPSAARADWPEANPARPSFSDNASTTATGALEIEAGLASEDDGDSGTAQYTFKYGITDRVDVRLNLEHGAWSHDTAGARSGLLLKYTLRVPDEARLGVAIEPYVNFPSFSDDPEGFGGGGLLAATYKRGRMQIDSSLVIDVDTADQQETAVTITPILTIGAQLVGDLGGYVEGAVDVAAGGGSTNPFAGAGLAYAVTPFLVLDAALYVGDEPRTMAFAGLTFACYLPPR